MKLLKANLPITIWLLTVTVALGWGGCSDNGNTGADPPPDSTTPQTTPDPVNNNQPTPDPNPRVIMVTTMGEIILELYPQAAPLTVKNFLRYVEEGFYEGTIFHRVISGFMIQGGGVMVDLKSKSPHEPIVNESDNGLKNARGTLAMGRSENKPDSATSMFYINHVDNYPLDHGHPENPDGFGYTVFGKVVQGMDVVDQIAGVVITDDESFFNFLPVRPIVIKKMTVEKQEP